MCARQSKRCSRPDQRLHAHRSQGESAASERTYGLRELKAGEQRDARTLVRPSPSELADGSAEENANGSDSGGCVRAACRARTAAGAHADADEADSGRRGRSTPSATRAGARRQSSRRRRSLAARRRRHNHRRQRQRWQRERPQSQMQKQKSQRRRRRKADAAVAESQAAVAGKTISCYCAANSEYRRQRMHRVAVDDERVVRHDRRT
jgi:hypothetical protein